MGVQRSIYSIPGLAFFGLTRKSDGQGAAATNDGSDVEPTHPDATRARRTALSHQQLVDALALTARGDWTAFRRVYAATSMKLFGVIFRIAGGGGS
jgi:hypothetical protein